MTIIILGLKLQFNDIWEKIGVQERAVCSCPGTPGDYSYCPYCGVRKTIKKIKMYRNKLNGEETTYRTIETLLPYLNENKLDIYDANPRGYTDDPIYLYLTEPVCYLEVSGNEPVNMPAISNYAYEIEDWLHKKVGEEVWSLGHYGLWAFNSDKQPKIDINVNTNLPSSNSSNNLLDDVNSIRTFIIPVRPPSFSN